MRTTMDGGGRVVIPKEVRARLGWGPRAGIRHLRVGRQGGVGAAGRADARGASGNTLVAATDQPMPVLSADAVRDVLEKTRR